MDPTWVPSEASEFPGCTEEERKEKEEQAALCSRLHLLVVMTPTRLWGTWLTIPDLDFRVRKESGSSKSQHCACAVTNPRNAGLAEAHVLVAEMGCYRLRCCGSYYRPPDIHSSKSLSL